MKPALVFASALFASTAGIASAADLPMLKSSAPVAPDCDVDWSGLYLGGHAGLAFGSTQWSNLTSPFNAGDKKTSAMHEGLLVGGQAGYNFQVGRWVLGVEGEASYATFDSRANIGGRYATVGSWDGGRAQTDALASLSARLGYSFGPALLYAKGGAAYAHDRYFTGPQTFDDQVINSAKENRFGWVAGLGIEYALGNNWSAKLEYDYYSFGNRTIRLAANPAFPGSQGTAKIARNDQLIQFGLNYHLGGNLEACCSIGPDFSGEFGIRAGFSTDRFKKKLYAPGAPDQLTSRVNYSNLLGVFGEVFGNIKLDNGIFAKAYLNGTNIFRGRQRDEDFADTYASFDDGFHSNTLHGVNYSRGIQGAFDLGYTAFKGDNWNVGGFVGYEVLQRHLSTQGCYQVGNGYSCTPAFPRKLISQSQDEVWQGVRVGLAGEYKVTDAIKLSASAAYLPYVAFKGRDYHWLRSNINSMKEHADPGQGLELEGVVSYALTNNVSVGVGGRYTWLQSGDGHTQFPGIAARSAEKFRAQQLGGFLQLSYRFGKLAGN